MYHYFPFKKGLYLDLCESALEMMAKEIEERVDWKDPDLFERIKSIVVVKFQIVERLAHILLFFTMIYADQKMIITFNIVEE